MQNRKVNRWWESPIWETKTNFDPQFNQNLLDEIYTIAKNIQTGKDSNPKDDLWDYDLPHLQLLKKTILDTITTQVMQYAEEARETEGLDIQFEYDFGWVNVKGPGERITMHAHSDSTISVVYYIKVPENSGNLNFLDTSEGSIFDREYINKDAKLKIKSITPKEGDLIFFPSYILHEVEENKSNDLRVSLSTDLKHTMDKDKPNAVILKSWVNDLVKIREYVPPIKK
jgi:uncharacterized protein (TIGR02466 family)